MWALSLGICLGLFGTVPAAQAQLNVLTVDNNPLISPGIDFFGHPFNTMGLALQAVDQGSDFNVTEVTPAAFRGMGVPALSAFDLIAILNNPQRSDDGNLAGLGTNWHQAVGVISGGCVVLSSHDPVRFHMNQVPGDGLFGAGFPGPGAEPFGAPDLVRQAALFAGSGQQTGLLIFDDAPSFIGGSGWDNAFLNLPVPWAITNLSQAPTGDGGYTSITLPANPIYAGLTAARFGVKSIGSFSANLGDISFHDSFGSFNPLILTPSERIINAGVTDVGNFNCCAGGTIPGPDDTPITLVRDCDTPPVADCTESVNPSGKKVPPAGSTTLPGPKGGQNEDGFYELGGFDNEDGTAPVFVTNASGSATFGPFASGSVVKITEAPGATPTSKPIGGPNSAVAAHIKLDSDAFVFAVDSAGQSSNVVSCLVPPPPK
jgi:hypothetical protein